MTTEPVGINILVDMNFVQVKVHMKPIEASDEIICRFCNLNGGLEAAMPFIAFQFKKVGADFSNPTKQELREVVEGLLRLLKDSKPPHIVARERRVMLRWLEKVEDT